MPRSALKTTGRKKRVAANTTFAKKNVLRNAKRKMGDVTPKKKPLRPGKSNILQTPDSATNLSTPRSNSSSLDGDLVRNLRRASIVQNSPGSPLTPDFKPKQRLSITRESIASFYSHRESVAHESTEPVSVVPEISESDQKLWDKFLYKHFPDTRADPKLLG